jgi:hypothetical protein
MVVGISLLLNFGVMYKNGVSEKEVIKSPTLTAVCPDTVYIKTADTIDEDVTEEIELNNQSKRNSFKMSYTKDLIKVFHNTHLTLKPSKNDSLQLSVFKSARGGSERQARENAQQIIFKHELVGNTLTLDKGVVLAANTPFKFQQVFAKLKVPVGTILIVDKAIMKMINTHYEEDFDIGETFKMTSKGLKCLDCMDTQEEDTELDIDWDNENGDMNIRIGSDDRATSSQTEIIKEGNNKMKVQ